MILAACSTDDTPDVTRENLLGATEEEPADGEDAGRGSGAGAGVGVQQGGTGIEFTPLGNDGDRAPSESREWTLLVYSLADTNLESSLLDDLREMTEAGVGDEVNVVAYVDRWDPSPGSADAGKDDDQPLLNIPAWTGAKILRLQDDGASPATFEELLDLGEVDMAAPATLAQFVDFGVTRFPSRHLGVVIADHGGGWTGIGPDQSSFRAMDVAGVAAGLRAGLGGSAHHNVDLLGFDACYMSTFGGASVLASVADYLVASEDKEPAGGWDYTSLHSLAVGSDGSALSPVELGRAFLDSFAEVSSHREVNTLSLLDLSEVSTLQAAVEAFAAALDENVSAIRADLLAYAGRKNYRTPHPVHVRAHQVDDLGALADHMGERHPSVTAAADAVTGALGEVRIQQHVGARRAPSSGMSIYLPTSFPNFRYADVTGADRWADLLRSIHTHQPLPAAQRPRAADPGRATGPETDMTSPFGFGDEDSDVTIAYSEADVTLTGNQVQVMAEMDPAGVVNVVEATLAYGVVDPADGRLIKLAETPAAVDQDGTVTATADLAVLTLTDAAGVGAPAYFSMTASDVAGLRHLDVPVDYEQPGMAEPDPVHLALLMDSGGEVTHQIYFHQDLEAVTVGELIPAPNGVVRPILQVRDPDGPPTWLPSTDVALAADLAGMSFQLEPMAPGQVIAVTLHVIDYSGNALLASATVEN
ncbi:clostripain-related cysteine peptidase [Euzebya pacifica]|nr:clostripain-related cysteine peptidase [Euzebya pacifica]